MSSSIYAAKKRGTGKDVIFLPSGGMHGWVQGRQLADYLEGEFTVHMLDLPGIGASKAIDGPCTEETLAAWLAGYLNEANVSKAIIAAHSLGGGIALAFAKLYPERTAKLVLLDVGHKQYPLLPFREFGPLALFLPAVLGMQRLFPNRINPFLFRLLNTEDADLNQNLEAFCSRNKLSPNDYIEEMFTKPASFTVEGVNTAVSYYRMPLPQMLSALSVPVMLAYGNFKEIDAKEAKATEKAIQKLHKKPDVLREVSGGHFIQFHDENLLKEIKQFIS